MDEPKINDAVRQCVRKCLAAKQPLVDLHFFLADLKHAGWRDAEIDAVKTTARKMLSMIYDLESEDPAA